MRPLVLVAHGSRDPRAAQSTRALARAVGAARPGSPVTAAFLDFSSPDMAGALADLSAEAVTVVPLLLTAAYHGRVDVPGEVAKVPSTVDVRLADVLGPVAGPGDGALGYLVGALRRRLGEPPGGVDGLVLAAAGTREVAALAAVDLVAHALGFSYGVTCRPGYASGAGPTVTEAMADLAARGARRIGVAAYFLAPGRLYDRAVRQARAAGAVAVAAVLGDAPEVVDLVLHRAA